MSPVRSAECRCDRSFTCGHCLANAKPYHFTPSDGSGAIYVTNGPINQRNPVPRNTGGCGHYLCGTAAALCDCPAAPHMLTNGKD